MTQLTRLSRRRTIATQWLEATLARDFERLALVGLDEPEAWDQTADERAAIEARLLNNMSLWLGGVGRRDEALAVARRACECYRSLAASRPAAVSRILTTG